MIKGEKVGNIAVIGERELVLGFRLVGVENSFIAEKEKGVEMLQEMIRDKKFSLVMISESIKSPQSFATFSSNHFLSSGSYRE